MAHMAVTAKVSRNWGGYVDQLVERFAPSMVAAS